MECLKEFQRQFRYASEPGPSVGELTASRSISGSLDIARCQCLGPEICDRLPCPSKREKVHFYSSDFFVLAHRCAGMYVSKSVCTGLYVSKSVGR